MVYLRDGNIYIHTYIFCGDGLDKTHMVRIGPRTLFSWKCLDLTFVASS